MDFVKGVLVVLMTVYHAMNHFADVPAEYYGYLRFVNGSFVFISGYVAALFYANSASPVDGASAGGRLIGRGLKLLGLFTALNLLASIAGATNYRNVSFDLSAYLENAADIYLSGESRQVAFRILMPIAYVLVLWGLVLLAGRWRSRLLAALIVASMLVSVVAAMPPNAFFVTVGIFGIAFGAVGQAHTPRIRSGVFIAVALAALASCMNFLSGNAVSYSFGVAAMLKLIFDAAALVPRKWRPFEATVLLGRYSLLCYILQIVFLYVFDRFTRFEELPTLQFLSITVIVTLGLLWRVCASLNGLRRHSRLVDRTYRLVFA